MDAAGQGEPSGSHGQGPEIETRTRPAAGSDGRGGNQEFNGEVDGVLAASRALVALIARSLADVLDQVTLVQFRVLVVLCAEEPLRSGALAERLGIHQSTFTRTADRLESQGWVRRETSAESRREVLVHLTDEGRELVQQVMRRRTAEIERILAGVSARERARIRTGFEAFARAAGDPDSALLLTLGVS